MKKNGRRGKGKRESGEGAREESRLMREDNGGQKEKCVRGEKREEGRVGWRRREGSIRGTSGEE